MEISLRQFKNIIKNLILRPITFWKNEKLESNSTNQFFTGYFLPLVLLAGAAEFAGQFLNGPGFYIKYPLLLSLREMLLFLIMYVFSIFITNQLIKPFGENNNLPVVRKLIGYSFIPLLLVSVVTNLFPFLYPLKILEFYSLYVFITGVEILFDFPVRKRTRYIMISILANLFVFSFISIFLSKMVASFL